MIDWDIVWRDYIGITWSGALGVVLSTIVLYLFFALLMHLSGPRLMANPTVGSFAVLAVIGGVTARATLGEAPTMLGALIVLNTLMVMEYLLGTMRKLPHPLPRRRPTVLMIGGRPVPSGLHRVHLSQRNLWDLLRSHGVLDLGDAELVILETRGDLTVVRRGSTIDRSLIAEVEGRETIPEHLLAG